jgi:carbamoyl-phosphate synthase large subunit
LDRIFNLSKKEIEKKLKTNIPNKILLIAEAIRKKIKLTKIYKLSKIDPWFLEQIKEIVEAEKQITKKVYLKTLLNLIELNQ